MGDLIRSDQKGKKAAERRSEYFDQTKHKPYASLVNDNLGRTLAPGEIEAVKIFVEYGNAISPSDQRYDNVVRSVIISGDIPNIVRFSLHSRSWLAMRREAEIVNQGFEGR